MSAKETLKFFEECDELVTGCRILAEQCPILRESFEYRRSNGRRRSVSSLDLVKLLTAGFSHAEIGKYLCASRDCVTAMTAKLQEAGVPYHYSQSRKKVASASTKPIQRTPRDKWRSLTRVVDNCKAKRYSISQTMYWLKCQDEYWQRRFEKRHVGTGVGVQGEATLMWMINVNRDGKVTRDRIGRRSRVKRNADQILKWYWLGRI